MAPDFALIVWAIPPVLIGVSAVYFLAAAPAMSLSARLVGSSHGAIGAVLYLAAWAIGSSGNSQFEYGLPYGLFFMVPVALVTVSFHVWHGPWQIHLLQLINLPVLFLAYCIGGMAITGDWL